MEFSYASSLKGYYPFGMEMPGRGYLVNNSYRYGFNGKENDGETSTQDYGMRIYDPRLGRFLSVDPLIQKYPELTPYQFASNCPIYGIDRDGLEVWPNNWLFDIWMSWKFGDPTGAKTLMSGAEQKAAVETRQMNYHNSTVPTSVQNKLDLINTNEANNKIASGTSQVVAFTIQTSAEVSSNIVPLGEVFNLYGKGLTNLIRYSGKAESFALKYADDVIRSTAKDELPRAVTAIVDTKTGKVYYGRSGILKNLDNVNPKLKELLPKESLEKWPVSNCAECDALNNALNNGAELKNLEMHTLKIDKKAGTAVDFERCKNCKITTKKIKTTSEKKTK